MAAIGDAGAEVGGVDIVRSSKDAVIRDITVYARDEAHGDAVTAAVAAVDGVEVLSSSDRVLLSHVGGKMTMRNRVPVETRDDLSMAYTPGVARVCMAINADPERVWELHHPRQQRRGGQRRELRRRRGRPGPRRRAAGRRGQVHVPARDGRHRRLPAAGGRARPGQDERDRRPHHLRVRGRAPDRHRRAALLRGAAHAGRGDRRARCSTTTRRAPRRRCSGPCSTASRWPASASRTARSWWPG